MLIEIDVAKQPVNRVWVGDENFGHWQKVEYENWPEYCSFCERIGHTETDCFKKNSTLQNRALSRSKVQQIYVAKVSKGKDKALATTFGMHEETGGLGRAELSMEKGADGETSLQMLSAPGGLRESKLLQMTYPSRKD